MDYLISLYLSAARPENCESIGDGSQVPLISITTRGICQPINWPNEPPENTHEQTSPSTSSHGTFRFGRGKDYSATSHRFGRKGSQAPIGLRGRNSDPCLSEMGTCRQASWRRHAVLAGSGARIVARKVGGHLLGNETWHSQVGISPWFAGRLHPRKQQKGRGESRHRVSIRRVPFGSTIRSLLRRHRRCDRGNVARRCVEALYQG